jgi:predicted DNA-binding transcriptional regulator YafY
VSEAHGADTMVELGVDDFDWLAGYLIGLGLDFEVLAPVELRRHIATLGAHLRRSHPPVARKAAVSPPLG